jgi:hypothetical protein
LEICRHQCDLVIESKASKFSDRCTPRDGKASFNEALAKAGMELAPGTREVIDVIHAESLALTSRLRLTPCSAASIANFW